MPYSSRSMPPMPVPPVDMQDAGERLRALMAQIAAAQSAMPPVEVGEMPSTPEPMFMDQFPEDAMGMDTGLEMSPLDGSYMRSEPARRSAPPVPYVGQRYGRG